MRLHIGGKQRLEGWKIFNSVPGEHVDFVGDVLDLSQFAAESCDEIYASHVLEHVPQARFPELLLGLWRILKPGGRVLLSVPDLDVLCWLFRSPSLDKAARWHVMRMIYGGQLDAWDFHFIGLTEEFLFDFLREAGFSRVERVSELGLFNDTSSYAPYGVRISLNAIAYKPANG